LKVKSWSAQPPAAARATSAVFERSKGARRLDGYPSQQSLSGALFYGIIANPRFLI
jgi:hypothetical protein